MDVPTQPAEGSQKQPEIGVHPTFLIYYPSVKSQISAHHAWPGGTKELRVVLRLCGHDSMGPKGVLVQSIDRIGLPTSPPPTSQSSGRGSTLEDERFHTST